MQTERIQVSREEATAAWQKYQSHRHNLGPLDDEITRIYRAISKGRMIVRASESIVKAGVGEDGLPKLAIARADQPMCILSLRGDGGGVMESGQERWNRVRGASRRFEFARGSFTTRKSGTFESVVPHIPPDIRPARGLQNYHVLYEALWTKRAPIDPMLLRRIGKGDMWLVCGAWDLTPVERAVMEDRLANGERQ